MTTPHEISFRVAACPEDIGDGKRWSFYVLNDSNFALDQVALETFEREWGNDSDISHPSAEILRLAPGSHALLWRDNDEEFRMLLYLLVDADDNKSRFVVTFPVLYKRINELDEVPELCRPGYVGFATELRT